MITKKFTKRIGATILAAVMMFGAVGDVKDVYAAGDENSVVTEEVTAYTFGQEMSGEILTEDAENIYSITTDETDSFYQLVIVNTGDDKVIDYKLFEDKDETKEVDSSRVYQKDTKIYNIGKAIKNHTYYLTIKGDEGCTYKFNVVKTPDDVSDSVDGAEAVAVGVETAKIIQNEKDEDWFCFTTDESDSFYELVIANTSEKNMEYALYEDKESTKELEKSRVWAKESALYNIGKANKNHTYFIKVWGDADCTYKINVVKTPDDVSDSADGAQAVAVGAEVVKAVQNKKDEDWFSFTIDASDSYYEFVIANTSEQHMNYVIYEDKEATKKVEESSIWAKTTKTYNMGAAIKNHTYYVKVWGDAGSTYKFNVVKTPDDASDNVDGAVAVAIGTQTSKAIQNKKDTDWFTFTTDASDSFYEFVIANTGENHMNYAIYENKEATKKVEESGIWAKTTKTYNMGKAIKNHIYYVKVWGDAGSTYKFNVVKTSDDISDEVAGAKKLVLNESKKYNIQNVLDTDYFTFETTDYVNYTLKFSNNSSIDPMTIRIYSGKDCLDNQKVCEYTIYSKKSVIGNSAKLKLKRFKKYYVKITGKSGTYTIGVNVTAPGSVKTSKAGKKNVSIKWKKVSRATGYEIYRAQGKNGKYKKITTIKKAGTVKFTDKKGLQKGKTYCYKIRAYKKAKGKTYYSAFSAVKTVKIK